MQASGLRLELRLDASPLLVSVTRRFVEEALEKFITDADFVSRVAMTTHELMENAAKYARNSKAELSVSTERDESGERVLTLRLSNRTTAAHIDRLKQLFTELDSCDDPLVLYVQLMRRNARATDISGLGLARIRAEGEMTLGLRVEGEMATILACTPVPPGIEPLGGATT